MPSFAFATELAPEGLSVKGFADWLSRQSPVISANKRSRVPVTFTWDRRLLTPVVDQGTCGACFMFSVVSAFEDRVRLFTSGQILPSLNAMALVLCMGHRTDVDSDCRGGTLFDAARAMYGTGVPERQCVSSSNILQFQFENQAFPTCHELMGESGELCKPSLMTDNKRHVARTWRADGFYVVSLSSDYRIVERELMYEIYSHGPVSVGMVIFPDFLTTDMSSDARVYSPRANQNRVGGHAVKLIGWGTTSDGVDYWEAANSWGEKWGNRGYFRVVRRSPALQLELNHICVTPNVPGSERFFEFDSSRTALFKKDVDRRLGNPVDPYTLISRRAYELVVSGMFYGDLRHNIFRKGQTYLPYNIALLRGEGRGMAGGTVVLVVLAVALAVAVVLAVTMRYSRAHK